MKILICQPDHNYFLWQLKTQMSNFDKQYREKDCVILLGYNKKPNDNALTFAKKTKAKVIFIEDTRVRPLQYHPNVVPHLMNKYFTHYKNDAAPFLYIGDDVLLTGNKLEFPATDKVFVADVTSYVSASYIKTRSEKIFYQMCNIVGVDPDLVEEKDGAACGGAQYLYNVIPPLSYWSKWERDSEEILKLLVDYNKSAEDKNRIQSWTAGMWAQLWNLWHYKIDTEVSETLQHCWPSTSIGKLNNFNFFHNAGVTEEKADTLFYKAAFRTRDPLLSDIVNIDQTKCSNWYAKQVIEGIDTFNSR